MDLQLLDAFVAVAETLSFTKAAKRLGVTPPTVSRNLARLEEELGVELVHRTTRTVSVSTSGQSLLERVAPHVAALRQAVHDLPERLDEPAGTLRLTAPFALGVVLLPEVVALYTARHPKVRVDAEFTNRNVDLVAEGFDLAIRGDTGQMPDSTLITRRVLARETLRVYASPSYVARRGEPRAVGAPEHVWVGFRTARAADLGLSDAPGIAADDFLFVREAIRAGAGVGFLPALIADPLVRTADLVQVLPEVELAVGQLVLLYPSRGSVSPKVAAFRDLLVAALQAG